MNARKREVFSAKVEAEINDPVKLLNSEFFSAILDARDIEALKDLRNNLPSAKPEANVSDPVRDLNSVFFPARLEVKEIEPVRDLNHEDRSARLEDDPIVALRAMARAFSTELA